MRRFLDSEIFFAASLGLVAVFCGSAPLRLLVRASSAGSHGPSLLSRLAPESTVGAFYATFLMLPAAVAFLAIGIPVFARMAFRGMRYGLARSEVLIMVALFASIATIGFGWHLRSAVIAGLVGVAVTCLAGCWPLLRYYGGVAGFRLIGVSGVFLAGLAVYEYRYVVAGYVSVAVAPTVVVFACFAAVTGLLLVTIGTRWRGLAQPAAVVLLWAGAALWAVVPAARFLADSPTSADWLELRATTFLAVLFLAAELVVERRQAMSD